MTFVVMGTLMLVGCVLQGIFITVEHKKHYVGAVILKGLASVVFCIIGYFALSFAAFVCGLSSNSQLVEMAGKTVEKVFLMKIAKLIFSGLILGAIGDILLNLRFVFEKQGQKIFLLGIAAFLAGHIVYLISLINFSNYYLICSTCGVILAAILLTIIFKSFDVKLAFKIFGVLYLGAVCLMACFAVGNYFSNKSTYTLLYALGALLFLVSDVVLIFNTFGKTTKFSLRITNLSLYYVGQLLIASSIFFI